MKFISGTPRDQLCLFNETLDSMISEDNTVRFLDEYVDKLDLNNLGVKTPQTNKGVGYAPRLYLKIYIYSYLNKIRSSRKIETECLRNVELIWLTKQLSPDHWSISNFRKQNPKALKNIFKEFLHFCYKLKLLSFDCVAIDGTKMRSQNSMSNVYHADKMDNTLEKIGQKIDKYINELESNDKSDHDEYAFLSKDIPKKLKQLRKHQDKLKGIKELCDSDLNMKRYFAGDPESNFQKDNGRCVVGYNCQSAVDEKNKLIISTDVTNKNNDKQQLNTMMGKIDKTKEELLAENRTICISDAGYHSESEIVEALKNKNTDIYIPHPGDVKGKRKRKKKKKDETIPASGFERENFIYDTEKDVVICPKGHELNKTERLRNEKGIRKRQYRCKQGSDCKYFNKCTKDKLGRTFLLSENHEIMEAFREKMKSNLGQRIIQKRKELVEHPFGTIKRNFGYTYFMQTGLDTVKSEFSFIAFIYNLKRVIKIVGVKKLIAALN